MPPGTGGAAPLRVSELPPLQHGRLSSLKYSQPAAHSLHCVPACDKCQRSHVYRVPFLEAQLNREPGGEKREKRKNKKAITFELEMSQRAKKVV